MKLKKYLDENKNMKLKYKAMGKDKQIFLNDRYIGNIEYNSAYNKFPYSVSMDYYGKLVTKSGEDVFSSIKIAKSELKKYLMNNKEKFKISEDKVVSLLKKKIDKLKKEHGYFSSSMLTKQERKQLEKS